MAEPNAVESEAQLADRTDSSVARRVVVVGAGLSGLTAAVDLRAAGWEVVVLEARDRVGGRVHTLREPLGAGLHAELGGESIDDTHLAIQELVARYGLTLESRPDDKIDTGVVEYRGHRSAVADFFMRGQGQVSADYASVADALSALAVGLDPEHPEAFPQADALDKQSFAQFLDALDLLPAAKFAATVVNRAGYASELEKVSLLFAAQQAAASGDETADQVETMRIAGGNDTLPQALAADLGGRVHLSSPVQRVEQQKDRVRVHAGGRWVEAAYAVLALPTPPLRKIVFVPPLPEPLAAAVAELELGPALKVVSEYSRSFWQDEQQSGLVVSDQPFGLAWSSSDSYSSQHGLLTQFVTGAAAHRGSKLSDHTRIEAALRELFVVYPVGASLRVGAGVTLSWVNEVYTGGGYAAYAPTQLTRFFPALRQGTARLRFAGEHTEALAGYMESAVRSGHRVAKELGSPP